MSALVYNDVIAVLSFRDRTTALCHLALELARSSSRRRVVDVAVTGGETMNGSEAEAVAIN